MTQTTLDQSKVQEFVGQVLTDASGFTTTLLASVGDRLGLWSTLAELPSVTSGSLASSCRISERYAREWLHAMYAQGYVAFDPAAGTFALPPEHAPAVAQEGGPVFFGGVWQMIRGMSTVFDDVVRAFRTGEGVPQSAYHEDMWDGMERFTAGWFENNLLQEWIPAMPDVQALLQRGCSVADIGCGRGRGLIKLAQAYERSTFIGFDAFEPTVVQARANADEAGVGDRVAFSHLDAAKGLPGSYDVIFTFDVIHDAVDPAGILSHIGSALNDGGVYVCLDINCSDRLEENAGPLGAFFLGCSTLYCLTTSLSTGGEGLGTLGLHPKKLDELARDAGFSDVRQVELENPFNNLYELRI